jgi:hypothetical protein
VAVAVLLALQAQVKMAVQQLSMRVLVRAEGVGVQTAAHLRQVLKGPLLLGVMGVMELAALAGAQVVQRLRLQV